MARLRIDYFNGISGAALIAAPLSLAAQAVPQIKLKLANAKLEHEFTRIGTVRELRDGRVLVTDAGDKRLYVVGFPASAEQIGRTGAGPSEYSQPNRLLALADDSTILDAGSRRWLMLVNAKIVATVPADDPVIAAARGLTAGVDQAGRLVSSHYAGRAGGDPAAPLDSPYLVLVNRKTAHVDTVGRLRPPTTSFTKMIRGSDGKDTPLYMGGPYYDAYEQVRIFSDGWTALARLFPYRVDWLRPDGKWVLGAPLAEPTPLNAREKQAYVERSARRAGRKPGRVEDVVSWPKTIPEYIGFDPVVLLAGPGNRLVVRRTPTADHEETRYDFIDRTGRLSTQVAMAENERIVGFGVKSVYVAWKDADDIERLRRHPWP